LNTAVVCPLAKKVKAVRFRLNDNFRNANLEMTNSEMEIGKLEVWNGPSRSPYYCHILEQMSVPFTAIVTGKVVVSLVPLQAF
jgi:hypothetical protein